MIASDLDRAVASLLREERERTANILEQLAEDIGNHCPLAPSVQKAVERLRDGDELGCLHRDVKCLYCGTCCDVSESSDEEYCPNCHQPLRSLTDDKHATG